MSRSSGTTRRRRRHGQPAACEAKRYAICGIENHGFRGVTNGRTRNWQAMQSGTHFAKTGGFRSHGTRLFHACWGAAPIPAEHKFCVLERWINPSAARFCKSLVGGQLSAAPPLFPSFIRFLQLLIQLQNTVDIGLGRQQLFHFFTGFSVVGVGRISSPPAARRTRYSAP